MDLDTGSELSLPHSSFWVYLLRYYANCAVSIVLDVHSICLAQDQSVQMANVLLCASYDVSNVHIQTAIGSSIESIGEVPE